MYWQVLVSFSFYEIHAIEIIDHSFGMGLALIHYLLLPICANKISFCILQNIMICSIANIFVAILNLLI